MRIAFVFSVFVIAVAHGGFADTANMLMKNNSLMKGNITCTECTDIIGVMFEVAKNATVRAALIADVNATCKMLFPKNVHEAELCINGGDDIVNKLFPWIDKELEMLAWDPRAFCSNFIPVCLNPCCATPTVPEKLRLSITRPNEMAITWTTLQNTSTHMVQWGTTASGKLSSQYNGWTRTYTDGGWVGVVHTSLMSGLIPNTQYSYRVGDNAGGWSKVWTFTTLPTNAGSVERPLRILQIGDMGYANKSDNTVAAMNAIIDAGRADLILHTGDISYADGDMPHWDVFLSKVESISARVPYMTNPGNHELWYNFTAYRTHFWMPCSSYSDRRMFYSFNYGGVHFTQMNTETFSDTANIDRQQVEWIEQDLAGRNNTLFTVATGHRPFYCSDHSAKGKDCGTFAELLRSKAEALLVRSHVDLVITSHMHGYERTWPTDRGQPTAHDYTHPTAPVYVVNGAGGNREGNDNPSGDQVWSAGVHTGSIGYAQITIAGPQLTYEFVVAANRTVIDSFTIVK